MRRPHLALVGGVLLIAAVAAAEDSRSDHSGHLSLRGGLGFSADPDAFLFGVEADHTVFDPSFSLGAAVQVGVDDDLVLVSPVVFGRWRFDLAELGPDWEPVEPYLQAGLGFTWWDVDGRRGRRDDDDLQFLTNFGLGLEYRFTEQLSVGGQMLFNFVPAEIFDERFYFSMEVLGLRYRF